MPYVVISVFLTFPFGFALEPSRRTAAAGSVFTSKTLQCQNRLVEAVAFGPQFGDYL